MASEQEELDNTAEAEIAQELREAAKESAAEGIDEVASRRSRTWRGRNAECPD